VSKIETSPGKFYPLHVLPLMAVLFALACEETPPSNAPTCASGQTDCSGACVDTKSDALNCGACGNACLADLRCSEGSCVLDCITGQTDCSGTCVDTKKDNANCGACGTACVPGEICSNGTCALSCQASLTDCNGTCVDTTKDRDNCGMCGNSCAAGEVCSNGMCALSCQVDLTDCNGICANLLTDIDNCGMCGMPCSAGEVCSNGTCALSCQTGLKDCNGLCVDVMSNSAHCGTCGNACAADAVCSNGTCASTTPVDLQFLSISDWHAQLDPLNVGGVDIGGASVLSAYFQNERAANPNTVTVTAGDAYGASPPLASFFNEVPAVKALNFMGLDVDTFGNHNFDKGLKFLQPLIDQATYKYVSSNLNNLAANLTGVESPYYLMDLAGVKVAFIGITNVEATSLLAQGSLGTITIGNEITSAMMAKQAAQAAGAQIFVALVHEGATLCDAVTKKCSGPLLDFAKGLNGFHVVFGDHTDIQVNEVVNGAYVVENKSKGVTYARVNLSVIPWTGFVTKGSATILSPVKSAVTPDPAIEMMLQTYRTQLSAQLDGVIGIASDVFPRGNNIERLGEVAIGNFVADSIRVKYGTQLAMVNGGGIRSPLPSTYAPANMMLRRTASGYASGPPYDLVTGDAYAVFPFGNAIVTRTVTGAQLWAAMEYGVGAIPAASGRFPQISGFGFTYSASAPAGARITEMHLMGGVPIPKDQTTFTMALSDFTNNGGDGYLMFADGQGVSRDLQADVLAEYIQTQMTITPTIEGRIVALP